MHPEDGHSFSSLFQDCDNDANSSILFHRQQEFLLNDNNLPPVQFPTLPNQFLSSSECSENDHGGIDFNFHVNGNVDVDVANLNDAVDGRVPSVEGSVISTKTIEVSSSSSTSASSTSTSGSTTRSARELSSRRRNYGGGGNYYRYIGNDTTPNDSADRGSEAVDPPAAENRTRNDQNDRKLVHDRILNGGTCEENDVNSDVGQDKNVTSWQRIKQILDGFVLDAKRKKASSSHSSLAGRNNSNNNNATSATAPAPTFSQLESQQAMDISSIAKPTSSFSSSTKSTNTYSASSSSCHVDKVAMETTKTSTTTSKNAGTEDIEMMSGGHTDEMPREEVEPKPTDTTEENDDEKDTSEKEPSTDLKPIQVIINWMDSFQDDEKIQLLCLQSLPTILEDPIARLLAQSDGLASIILHNMTAFPTHSLLQLISFHTLVVLLRPLGTNEGMVHKASQLKEKANRSCHIIQISNPSNTTHNKVDNFNKQQITPNATVTSSHCDGSYDPFWEENGVRVMLDSLRRYSHDRYLQAMGCWAMVNAALYPSLKASLLRLGAVYAVTNAMMLHPNVEAVQFRGLFALINLVIPVNKNRNGDGSSISSHVYQLSRLTILAMKNFHTNKSILNRGCLVLRNLSLNPAFVSILAKTPGCIDMLLHCRSVCPRDALVQRSAKTIMILIQRVTDNDAIKISNLAGSIGYVGRANLNRPGPK